MKKLSLLLVTVFASSIVFAESPIRYDSDVITDELIKVVEKKKDEGLASATDLLEARVTKLTVQLNNRLVEKKEYCKEVLPAQIELAALAVSAYENGLAPISDASNKIRLLLGIESICSGQ